jgi:diguanylate cyclase (GGDEF)-like protein/PAS domain S-box-containing protein
MRGAFMMFNKKAYQMILDNLYDGLYFVDNHRVIRYWNKGAERISGYSAKEVVGTSCADNILTHVDSEGNKLCTSMCPLAAAIADKTDREAEVFMHHKDGHRIPVSVRVSAVTNDEGNAIGGVELFTDISNYKSIELRARELEEMALLDNLTRLANRNCIEKEFFTRFEEERRFGVLFGILFMDIDHFKNVNDTYGHDVGDQVLKFVADTLVKNARPFDVVGRWGGEEFIGIIRNVNAQQLKELGNRMRMLVESSYLKLANDKLQVTISMGATLMRPKDNMDSLIKRADTFLYESKRAGRNRLTVG